jgi:hypothetical protein
VSDLVNGLRVIMLIFGIELDEFVPVYLGDVAVGIFIFRRLGEACVLLCQSFPALFSCVGDVLRVSQ